MSESSLTVPQESKPALQPEISIAQLMQGVVQAGITPASVDVMERLCALRERENAAFARREFAQAFAKLQADMPQIVACKAVPGSKPDEVRYWYAPFEEIMTKARGALQANGFSIRFDTDIADGRVIVTCKLMHVGGHEESNKFAARIGNGPPGSSDAQKDGAATTYAKRFAICAALNIFIEKEDTDARIDDFSGLTADQANELRKLVKETKADEAKFFATFGAADYSAIPSSRFDDALGLLKRRKAKLATETHAEDQRF